MVWLPITFVVDVVVRAMVDLVVVIGPEVGFVVDTVLVLFVVVGLVVLNVVVGFVVLNVVVGFVVLKVVVGFVVDFVVLNVVVGFVVLNVVVGLVEVGAVDVFVVVLPEVTQSASVITLTELPLGATFSNGSVTY